MTETEWFDCSDVSAMLDFLPGKVSDRKLRLFATACCRRIWHRLSDMRSQNAIEVAEQYVDGRRSEKTRNEASHVAYALVDPREEPPLGEFGSAALAAFWAIEGDAIEAADAVRDVIWFETHSASSVKRSEKAFNAQEEEQELQCHLLRCIFGNPFRSLPPKQGKKQWKEKLRTWLHWHDATVPKLAQAIYDERELPSGHLDAARLAILADALEEAGCTDQTILEHCRGPAPHVRGCWVVDLLLGKE